VSYLQGAGAAILLIDATDSTIARLAERMRQVHVINDQAFTIWLGPELETLASLDRAFGTFDASFGEL
jgi:hypothetical protein